MTIPNGGAIVLNGASDGKQGGAGGAAILHTVNVTSVAGSAVLSIYNGTSSNGTLISTIDAATRASTMFFNIRCEKGVYAVLSGGNAFATISVV
jgi:hypothetical protein